jgi:ABC-2 type transport system ATP-binding protein
MLEIKNLNISLGDKTVLQNLNLKLAAGQVHGIIGLNGAGKTTFFNVLNALVKPDSGEILWQQIPLKYTALAYLETSNFFYHNLTGREYLHVFPKTNSNFNLGVCQDLLQLPLDTLISGYSTGMKKKLALLAILQQDKAIYVLDEPFNGLDLESNRTLEMIIHLLREKGKTILVSAHILEPLLHTCDQIHLLQKGSVNKTFEKEQFAEIREQLFANLEIALRNQLHSAL